jgi:hypothetical protein
MGKNSNFQLGNHSRGAKIKSARTPRQGLSGRLSSKPGGNQWLPEPLRSKESRGKRCGTWNGTRRMKVLYERDEIAEMFFVAVSGIGHLQWMVMDTFVIEMGCVWAWAKKHQLV